MDQDAPNSGTPPTGQPSAPQSAPTGQPVAPGNQPTTPAGKGYGKKPKWMLWLIYIVVGAVVYFLIYWIFFRHSGTGNSGSLY